jgi:hypothetical protein
MRLVEGRPQAARAAIIGTGESLEIRDPVALVNGGGDLLRPGPGLSRGGRRKSSLRMKAGSGIPAAVGLFQRRPFPQTRFSECVDFFTGGVFALPRGPCGEA